MALETLKNVREINGVKIMQDRPKKEDGSIDWEKFDELRKEEPIYVDHDVNMVSFRIQNGPIKEVGKNGCQVTDMVAVAKHIFEKLNEKFPCEENVNTIHHLQMALEHQEARTRNRINRGVEGTSQA
ncbi:hypothetical protein ACES2L_05930 [Bdellovibrio bacteriovorus]